MDLSTLIMAHYALSLGSVREAARALERPPSSVSAALARLQARLATPLTTTAANRLMPTPEGRRLLATLSRATDLILGLVALSGGEGDQAPRAARLAVSLLALERLLAVERAGSIRRAASELEMGQPQLTRQIKGLERQLGVALLTRGTAGVATTPAGARAVALAEELDALCGRLFERADESYRLARATTRLGCVPPLGAESRIARILACIAAAWPDHRPRHPLVISSHVSEELLAGLRSGQFDVVLVDTDEIPAEIDRMVISEFRLGLFGATELIRAHRGGPAELLLHHPIAMPSLKSGLRQRLLDLTQRALTEEQRRRLRITEIESIPVIANLLVEHGYVSLLPMSARGSGRERPGDRMASIPLDDAYMVQLALAWKPGAHAEASVRTVVDILTTFRLIPYRD